MRLFRPLWIARLFFPEALFRIKSTGKVLYLTFDDGPSAETTFPLLRILSDNGIKAVFFCSGKAASEHPDLIQILKSAGHIVGNHGFSHKDGFFTSSKDYLDDINCASEFTSPVLFRPPFGHLKPDQYAELRKTFRIIMWDIMPYDFDMKFGGKRSLAVLRKLIRPGSIIALHDKQESTMLEFVEEFIVHARSEGYRFELLPLKNDL